VVWRSDFDSSVCSWYTGKHSLAVHTETPTYIYVWCHLLLLLPPPAEASRAELALELVPGSLLPKLQRMVQLMITAQYAPAQHGYAALRERALQQVR
jgi:hypothetical protein